MVLIRECCISNCESGAESNDMNMFQSFMGMQLTEADVAEVEKLRSVVRRS